MKFRKFSLAILFFIINFVLLYTFISNDKYSFKIGEVAQESIAASRDIENKVQTEALIKRAVEQAEPVYRINPTIQAEIKADIDGFFYDVKRLKVQEDLELEQKLGQLRKEHFVISEKSMNTAVNMELAKLDSLKNYIFEIISQIMSTGVKKEDIELEKENISEFFEEIDKLSQDEKLLGIELMSANIKANKFLDMEKTQQNIEDAKDSVERVVIKKGENIISRGEVITSEKMDMLKEAGISGESLKDDIFKLAGITLILIVMETFLGMYIYLFKKSMFVKERQLLMLLMIMMSIFIISLIVNVVSPYIMPMAGASMLISILLGSNIALVSNMILSIMAYVVIGDVNLFMVFLISGSFAAFTRFNMGQRRSVIISGLKIGLINVMTLAAFGMLSSMDMKSLIVGCMVVFLSGILSSILVVGSLPIWEHYFDVLTSMKLLELSNPNNEILKRMLIETPGTYHHSMIVGNLAERACERIGANSLFARVASYYHDTGKLTRPYFFKENQFTNDNPHDRIVPSLSAQIIKEHITRGVEIAKKHKLPNEIVNVIKEHHGTTLVAYFYYKLKNEGENPDELQFRYAGPKPQTREAAVVMLADSSEAAIRSIKEPTRESIRGMIDKVVNGKIEDGQLENSDLTLKEIQIVKDSFLEVIMGMFHERIEYPEEKDIK